MLGVFNKDLNLENFPGRPLECFVFCPFMGLQRTLFASIFQRLYRANLEKT